MVNSIKNNKKAWLRIVEAFIAIIIIITTILIIVYNQPKIFNNNEEIFSRQKIIFEKIDNNETLREMIVKNKTEDLMNEISYLVPESLGFAIKICSIEEICSSTQIPDNKEIFAQEIIITSSVQSYNPKKLRIFIWNK
jgi:hypothetical protein